MYPKLFIFTEKSKMKNISTILVEISTEELRNLPVHIQSCFITRNPKYGFILSIPLWEGIEKDSYGQYENGCFDIPGIQFQVNES